MILLINYFYFYLNDNVCCIEIDSIQNVINDLPMIYQRLIPFKFDLSNINSILFNDSPRISFGV